MFLDQSTIGKAVCNGNNAKKERTSGSDIYPAHKLCDRGRSGGGPRTEGQGKHKLSSCKKVKVGTYCCLTKCQSEHYLLLWPVESVWLELYQSPNQTIFLLRLVAEGLWTVNLNHSLQDTHSPQREQHSSSHEYWTIPGLSDCGYPQGLWTQGKH